MAKNLTIKAEDTISMKWAALILLLSLLTFLLTGVALTSYFLGEYNSPETKADINYQKGLRQISENPDSPQAHIDLGWVYLQQGKFTLAEKEYKKALQLDENNVVAIYNMALLEIERGKKEEARRLLENIKERRPNFIKARATLGFVYTEMGSFQKALDEFALVEKYYPGSADLMFQYARLYQKKGDNTKAKYYLIRTLEFDPKYKAAKEMLKKLK